MPRIDFLTHCLRRAAHLLGAALLLCACGASAQTAPAYKLHIVGGLVGLHTYTRHEEPFWTRELSRLSAGRFDADIVPFDRAGIPATEMLRLVQLGVVPFGTMQLSAIAAQFPEYGGVDLAGMNPDMASLKRSVAAFRPYLEKQLRDRHGVELLALYVYPAQVIFCKKPLTGLSDLAQRRIRVSGATQADFIGALGAVPVLTGFAEIMTHWKSGNVDCAITGSMSGNSLGLAEVASHLHALPLTWGLSVFGANRSAWDALPPDLKSLLRRELPRLEAGIWAESEAETAQGIACNQGAANCTAGRRGRMVLVPISAQDERRRQEIFNGAVLARWLQRCPTRCAEVWSQTLGPARGSVAPAAP
jgi:TRAP-type C4-dicarboxylate transport system substrate-binding protein